MARDVKQNIGGSSSGFFSKHPAARRILAGVLMLAMLLTTVAVADQVALSKKNAAAAAEQRAKNEKLVNSLDPNGKAVVSRPKEANGMDSEAAASNPVEENDADDEFSRDLSYSNTASANGDYEKALEYAQKLEGLAKNDDELAAAYVQMGNIYSRLKKYGDALGYYNKTEGLSQSKFAPSELSSLRARCYLLKEDAQGAIDECADGLSDPRADSATKAELYVFRGAAYMNIENYAAAAADFRSAIDAGSDDAETLKRQIALCDSLTGDKGGASASSAGAAPGGTERQRAVVQALGKAGVAALSYYAMGAYDKAADAYTEMLSSGQTYYTKAQIYSCIAKCRIFTGQYDAAIKACGSGIKMKDKSESPTLYSLRGTANMAKGDNLAAAQDYDTAVKAGYSQPKAVYKQAAACYYFAGKYSDSVRCGEAAQSGEAADTEATLWVGLSYYMLQDYKAGAGWLERALKVNQSYCEKSEIGRILTRCYLLLGDYDSASVAATSGLEETGDKTGTGSAMTGEMYALRGASYLSLGKYDSALSDFYSAIAMGYSNTYEIYKQCTLCNFLLGDYKQAVSCGERALDNGKGTAELYYWMGISYFSLEDYQKGDASLQAAAQMDDTLENLYFYLGVCSFALGEYQRAADYFTTSIDRGQTAERSTYNRGLCELQLEEYDKAKADIKSAAEQTTDASVASDAKELQENLAAVLK